MSVDRNQTARRIRRWCAFLTMLSISLAIGCAGTAMPDLYHPGPAGYQRYWATQHDPYPLDDVAEPVVGGRPREFQRPVPEPVRAVQFDERHPPVAAAPAPATFSPAPIGTPQPVPSAVPVVAFPPGVAPPVISQPVPAAPPTVIGSPYAVPSPAPYSAPATAPYVGPPVPPSAPATTAPYQIQVPATTTAPAPFSYGATVPIAPSPVPPVRAPY